MTPINHPNCNAVLKRPPGTTEEDCGDLPIMRTELAGRPIVTSFWLPDSEEAANLASGGALMLSVWGATHPPLGLAILPPAVPATPPAESGADSPPETPPDAPDGPYIATDAPDAAPESAGMPPDVPVTPLWRSGWARIRQFIADAATGHRSRRDARAIRAAIDPVLDWYQSDEHPPRPLPAIVADIVHDLQGDRADAIELIQVKLECQRLREEVAEVRREAWQREAEILTLSNGDRPLPDASNNTMIVWDQLQKAKALRKENAELRDKLNLMP